LVAAESDEEAGRLATSAFQRHLNLLRGAPIFVPAPVDSMDGLWSESERFLVESRLAVAAIGSPDTVQQNLAHFLSQTNVDELIFTSDLYEHRHRMRSFEIAAEAMKTLEATEVQRV
jgi:alkanesulfonate monooxygenase SsuD/methylene tetrahydromethanopterin reductase-like flavin-dependent oxidoreductase (luciferase family)